MKHTVLLTFTIAFLALACNDSKYNANSDQSSTGKAEEKLSLSAGLEAKTNQKAGLWTQKELKVLEGTNGTNVEAGSQLKPGTVVFISNVGDEYSKVMTIIGQEGYIFNELLDPHINNTPDSARYFEKKKIARINTFVDGMDVGTVKLWSDMTSRDRMVDQLSKGEKVAILQEQGDYVKLVTINGTEGWCMKGFIKK